MKLLNLLVLSTATLLFSSVHASKTEVDTGSDIPPKIEIGERVLGPGATTGQVTEEEEISLSDEIADWGAKIVTASCASGVSKEEKLVENEYLYAPVSGVSLGGEQEYFFTEEEFQKKIDEAENQQRRTSLTRQQKRELQQSASTLKEFVESIPEEKWTLLDVSGNKKSITVAELISHINTLYETKWKTWIPKKLIDLGKAFRHLFPDEKGESAESAPSVFRLGDAVAEVCFKRVIHNSWLSTPGTLSFAYYQLSQVYAHPFQRNYFAVENERLRIYMSKIGENKRIWFDLGPVQKWMTARLQCLYNAVALKGNGEELADKKFLSFVNEPKTGCIKKLINDKIKNDTIYKNYLNKNPIDLSPPTQNNLIECRDDGVVIQSKNLFENPPHETVVKEASRVKEASSAQKRKREEEEEEEHKKRKIESSTKLPPKLPSGFSMFD